MQPASAVLSWLHFGDLHLTDPGEPNHRDLLALIDAANRNLAGGVDFALLPGDNADDGSDAQFRLVREAIDRLDLPVRILPGDHDFHTRNLDAFHAVLGAPPLPRAERIGGHRCLFLDVVSAGGGGPDFRLDATRLDWIENELQTAACDGERVVVFMHAFPADLREGAQALTRLLGEHRVACVDTGHTHYNELVNDGRTILMATRSTGQIEEGPVGFSLAAVDGGVVSWRFQPLAADWPVVLITSPADHRLITDPTSSDQVVRDGVRIAAKIWHEHPIEAVSATIDLGAAIALRRDETDASLWRGTAAGGLADGPHQLRVGAHDAAGHAGDETITFLVNRDGRYEAPARHADGSDRDSIGAWPEKHLVGTQLGPNRNGRKW